MAEKRKKKKENPGPHIPKDAQVIMAILKETNLTNKYEPRVVNQLLEFTYRVLTDAKSYAKHANKKSIDVDDIKLALQIQQENSFTSPPSRQLMHQLAEKTNSMPLPPIKPRFGIRLPENRYCLTSTNVKNKDQSPGDSRDHNVKMSFKANVGAVKRTPNFPVISYMPSVYLPKTVGEFTSVSPKTFIRNIDKAGPRASSSTCTSTSTRTSTSTSGIDDTDDKHVPMPQEATHNNQSKRKRENSN